MNSSLLSVHSVIGQRRKAAREMEPGISCLPTQTRRHASNSISNWPLIPRIRGPDLICLSEKCPLFSHRSLPQPKID